MWYMCIGIGIYLGCAVKDWGYWREADWIALVKGILGIFVWPAMLYIMYKNSKKKELVDIQPVNIREEEEGTTIDCVVQAPNELENYGFPRKK